MTVRQNVHTAPHTLAGRGARYRPDAEHENRTCEPWRPALDRQVRMRNGDEISSEGGDVSNIFTTKTDAYYGGQRRSASQHCSGQKLVKERI